MIGPAHETHPLFADRPELDALAFAVVFALHKQVPEDKRPTSWSDFTEAQVLRAKEAAALAYDAGFEAGSVEWLAKTMEKAITSVLMPTVRNDPAGRASIERAIGNVLTSAFPYDSWRDHVHVAYSKTEATMWAISEEGQRILAEIYDKNRWPIRTVVYPVPPEVA